MPLFQCNESVKASNTSFGTVSTISFAFLCLLDKRKHDLFQSTLFLYQHIKINVVVPIARRSAGTKVIVFTVGAPPVPPDVPSAQGLAVSSLYIVLVCRRCVSRCVKTQQLGLGDCLFYGQVLSGGPQRLNMHEHEQHAHMYNLDEDEARLGAGSKRMAENCRNSSVYTHTHIYGVYR